MRIAWRSSAAAAAQQDRQIAHVERFVERFRYKATKARQVQSRLKTLEKLERIEVPDRAQIVAKFGFPEPQRSSRVVIEVDDATVGYDGEAVLADVDLVVERGHKLAVVGPNGAGKSTLLRMLVGELEPMRGTSALGSNVDIAHFAQHQVDVLPLDRTVTQVFTNAAGPQPKTRNLRTVLGSFGFSGEAVDRRVGDLSGGERTRLALAICMVNPVNLLILDEPTNHLDLPSCDMLEDALTAYPGTVLLVSHDRHLIRSVADDLLEVRNGSVRLHQGVEERVLTPSFEGGAVGPSSAPPVERAITPQGREDEGEARRRRVPATTSRHHEGAQEEGVEARARPGHGRDAGRRHQPRAVRARRLPGRRQGDGAVATLRRGQGPRRVADGRMGARRRRLGAVLTGPRLLRLGLAPSALPRLRTSVSA